MSMTIYYDGQAITPRTGTFTLHGSFVDLYDMADPITLPERELTITLQPGQTWTRWNRRAYTRGKDITLYINDTIFDGRVKYRRLGKMVVTGRFRRT
jgi:hypothetical protein